jgi:hypothetical protein
LPSIAEYDELRRHPQPAYPQYEQVRERAQRGSRFVAPADLPRYGEVMARRGTDWCTAVLGRPVQPTIRDLSTVDARMLLIADELGLDPPLPDAVLAWRQVDARRAQQREQRAAEGERRRRERWEAARATSTVALEVRANAHGHRRGERGVLNHAVPLVDARSATRRHPSGRALCETPSRSQPLSLTDPVDEPATCVRCLNHAETLRPVGQ